MHLPTPTQDEIELSHELNLSLRKTAAEKSPFWFSDFMEGALYTPQLGYYQNARTKFGSKGDFITAPALSSAFGRTLAAGIEPLLNSLPQQNILEYGGGTGILSADILIALGDQLNHYFILEVSASLMIAQKETIQSRCPEHFHKVRWIQKNPEHFVGVIIANEVLDAMPVHRFKIGPHRSLLSQAVIWKDHQWQEEWVPAPIELLKAVHEIEEDLETTFSMEYQSEYNPWINPWISSLSDSLSEGFILLIDYGASRKERYQTPRSEGTFRCYHKQYVNQDPFWYPGLQDMTSDVDFTQVAIAATEANLKVSGYCSQGAFLMSLGITDSEEASLLERQAIQQLISPGGMGEFFKVILLTRSTVPPTFTGFKLQNDLVKL